MARDEREGLRMACSLSETTGASATPGTVRQTEQAPFLHTGDGEAAKVWSRWGGFDRRTRRPRTGVVPQQGAAARDTFFPLER